VSWQPRSAASWGSEMSRRTIEPYSWGEALFLVGTGLAAAAVATGLELSFRHISLFALPFLLVAQILISARRKYLVEAARKRPTPVPPVGKPLPREAEAGIYSFEGEVVEVVGGDTPVVFHELASGTYAQVRRFAMRHDDRVVWVDPRQACVVDEPFAVGDRVKILGSGRPVGASYRGGEGEFEFRGELARLWIRKSRVTRRKVRVAAEPEPASEPAVERTVKNREAVA